MAGGIFTRDFPKPICNLLTTTGSLLSCNRLDSASAALVGDFLIRALVDGGVLGGGILVFKGNVIAGALVEEWIAVFGRLVFAGETLEVLLDEGSIGGGFKIDGVVLVEDALASDVSCCF